MAYLLETTVCIALIRGVRQVVDKILSVGEENCAVSEMTIAELYYGAVKSGRKSHLDDVQFIMDAFEIVPVFTSLKTYGEIKTSLESKGKRIDEFDLLIAATALHNSMTLASHNTKHFARIAELKLEDWER